MPAPALTIAGTPRQIASWTPSPYASYLRGMDHDVGRANHAGDVGAETGEGDPAGKLEIGRTALPGGQLRPVPGHGQMRVPRRVAAQNRPGFEETVESLAPIAQRPDEERHRTIERPAKLAPAKRYAPASETSENCDASEP